MYRTIGRQWKNNAPTNRLITGGINHVSENLFSVLDAPTFGIPVPEEYKLLLLACPQPANTLSVQTNHAKIKRTTLQHYHKV